MNIIDIIDEQHFLNEEHVQLIESLLDIAHEEIGHSQAFELDVSIVDDKEIHRLNREFRGIDRPTDVLSFAMEDISDNDDFEISFEGFGDLTSHLGDIIISIDKLKEQASEYGHSFERELGFLVVHGFLHLNGYDHQTPDDEEVMFSIQERVLEKYGLTR